MALSIYKSGQGYWTRMLTAGGCGAIILCGVLWLWGRMETLTVRGSSTGDPSLWDRFMNVVAGNIIYCQSGMAVVMILVFGGLVYWLLNKPNIADFMIATEVEMKKVNWPSKKEIIGSTWVVICGTLILAGFLFFINIGFAALFKKIGVLM